MNNFNKHIVDIGKFGIVANFPEKIGENIFIIRPAFNKPHYIVSKELSADPYECLFFLHKYIKSPREIIDSIPAERAYYYREDKANETIVEINRDEVICEVFYAYLLVFERYCLSLVVSAAFYIALFQEFLSLFLL